MAIVDKQVLIKTYRTLNIRLKMTYQWPMILKRRQVTAYYISYKSVGLLFKLLKVILSKYLT